MAVRNHSSAAVGTTLTADITTTGATTCTVAATTGFPATPFIAIIEPDTIKEEVVLVTNVATLTLTITRGYDSSTAATHVSGSKLQHSFSAIDFREANDHINNHPAGTLTGTIPATVLGNSTVYIGTTGVALNRGSAALTLAGITLTTPTIADFTNASHDHSTAAEGGTLTTYAAVGQTMYIGTTGVAINRASAALTLAGITLTTPTIADFTNAGHTHAAAASGGTLSGYSPVAGSSSIVTTGTVTSGVWSTAITNALMTAPKEKVNIQGSAIAASTTFDVLSGQILYYTTASTAGAVTLNFRGNGSTTLATMIPNDGDSVSCTLLCATGASTPAYVSVVQVDGTASGVTTKWQYGSGPSAGNASATDGYTFTIINTAAGYTVFASFAKAGT